MSIDPNHPTYRDLRRRIRENPKDFVAIVGAGLSRPGGLPLWDELKDHLVKYAKDRISSIQPEEQESYERKLERIKKLEDLWDSFSALKHLLPKEEYRDAIRGPFEQTRGSSAPVTYDLLWKLQINGIVTFNIDTYAADAYARANGRSVDTATGRERVKMSQFLASGEQFILKPHGYLSDPSTWVFTTDERTALTKNKSYIDFVKSLCQSRNLLILGFNPNNFAFEYLLDRTLEDRPLLGGRHYCLLPRPDSATERKLSQKGLRTIPYETRDAEKHPEIKETLTDFLAFIPRDETPSTVYEGTPEDPSSLPSEEELLEMGTEKARKLLNSAVASIIPQGKSPSAEDIRKLEQFYRDHIRAINDAWLVAPDSSQDMLHGYKVHKEKGRGAFGRVLDATEPESGDRVAIKVLLPNVRRQVDYLNSFRRGVQSMRILTENGIGRMVPIYEAYEVPACVVMEYIDGPTLTEAVEWKYLHDLAACLEVLTQVGEVVEEAHDLDEIVLHRDLKPDNVILRNGYNPQDKPNVAVVDFDLSWHEGASDLSVVHGARAQGYAAPEQTAVSENSDVSTRNTAVDVFGYGMLAFFVFTQANPRKNEQNFDGFEESIRRKIKNNFSYRWKCLPHFLSRTVSRCTFDNQKDRISFSAALRAFQRARSMALVEEIDSTDPLLLEELAALVAPEYTLTASEFGRKMSFHGPDPAKEVILELEDQYDEVVLRISIHKERRAAEDRNVGKYLTKARDKAKSELNSHPLENIRGEKGLGSVHVSGEWSLPDKVKRSSIDHVAQRIQAAKTHMDLN